MESGRSFSSPSAPLCWKSTWTWAPVTSTELPGANHVVISTKLLPTQIFQFHLAPTLLWGPGAVPGEWTDVCGFVSHPDSCDKWKVRLHGAFTMPRETLGLRPKEQSCHHEVWLHLDLVGNQSAHEPRGNHEQRVLLKERSCPYPPNKEKGRYDDESDRSLSSLSSVRELMLPQAACTTHQGHPTVKR